MILCRPAAAGNYILLPREEVISNSYAALSLLVAEGAVANCRASDS
ncbi:Uncharacterised protein [Kluyvera cryocrescens]|uniref:Uncharacterized protein n=1 Tax=Kluyvera cryocrescens TaxID=580 RepID=A0A485A4Q1_KLUCR|nr:Uncharacterised protein [Kluyvera cryocrescens]